MEILILGGRRAGVGVEDVSQPVAGPRPGLDLEAQGIAVGSGPPASRCPSSVTSRNEVSSRLATRTGPSHGPGMPPRCAARSSRWASR